MVFNYIVCHQNCARSLPNLCGVPSSVVAQFTMHNHRQSMLLDDGSIAIDVTSGAVPKIEGWLKFPRM